MSLTTLDGLAFAVVLLVALAMAESANERSRKRSVSHKDSPNHREYLETLRLPSSSTIQHITAIQQHNEAEIDAKYHPTADDDEVQAATKIQQAYRGFRDRRQLEGKTLDPSARWAEAIKELRFREATKHGRPSLSERRPSTPEQRARANWRLVGEVAAHAAGEDCSPPRALNDAAVELSSEKGRQTDPMFLDLRYFLEMVDTKHRYGTNLQVYHEEWQRSLTKQNFFEWLDHGEGRKLDLRGCSREKLDRERIRYLSREERRDYEVLVDEAGKLRWLKTGELITTSSDYQDSAHGIVAKGSPEAVPPALDPDEPSSSSSYDSDTGSELESTTSLNPIPPEKRKNSKRTKARHHFRVSPATILNHLLRASVKPGTWIYVSDTVGRLYVGIKTSGAFQHASFLAGARIFSAGLIGIENGQLVYLSPLSGHYRPTTQSFTAFIASLKRQGVDMEKVKVSGAYDVLVGMERYGKMKKGLGKVVRPHRRKDSGQAGRRQSGVQVADIDAISAVERHWGEEHARPRGLSRLVSDLHIRRRSSVGQEPGDI